MYGCRGGVGGCPPRRRDPAASPPPSPPPSRGPRKKNARHVVLDILRVGVHQRHPRQRIGHPHNGGRVACGERHRRQRHVRQRPHVALGARQAGKQVVVPREVHVLGHRRRQPRDAGGVVERVRRAVEHKRHLCQHVWCVEGHQGVRVHVEGQVGRPGRAAVTNAVTTAIVLAYQKCTERGVVCGGVVTVPTAGTLICAAATDGGVVCAAATAGRVVRAAATTGRVVRAVVAAVPTSTIVRLWRRVTAGRAVLGAVTTIPSSADAAGTAGSSVRGSVHTSILTTAAAIHTCGAGGGSGDARAAATSRAPSTAIVDV